MIIYELLAGETPFGDTSAKAIFMNILTVRTIVFSPVRACVRRRFEWEGAEEAKGGGVEERGTRGWSVGACGGERGRWRVALRIGEACCPPC